MTMASAAADQISSGASGTMGRKAKPSGTPIKVPKIRRRTRSIARLLGSLPITPGGLGVVDSIAPVLLVGFGVPAGVATLGVLGWRVVNFWLPIPTGALSFVSLKVKPGSRMRAFRSTVSGLLVNGKPPDATLGETAGDADGPDGPDGPGGPDGPDGQVPPPR